MLLQSLLDMKSAASLRDLMRQSTTAAHAALEDTGVIRAFSTGAPSVAQYADYLLRQLRLHAPLESMLADWMPADWTPWRLRRSTWLRSDLRALGVAPDTRPAALPTVGSWAEAVGVLYVLEGGSLGLQVVRKRMPADHPALGEAGRFLLGYGSDTGRHWRAFVERIDTLPAAQWTLAVHAANQTFAAFLRIYCEPLHEH